MAVGLFVEVRRNVEAAIIHVSVKTDYLFEEMIIRYEKFTITVSLFDKENVLKEKYRYKLKSSETFFFKPHSPSGHTHTVLNFKSNLTNQQLVTVRAEIEKHWDFQDISPAHLNDGIPEEHVKSSIKCRHCGNIFLNKHSFDKVFPLPSTEWQDIAGEWYCHKHPDDTKHLPKDRYIVPKEDQCFVTESSLIFNEKNVQNIQISDHHVKCNMCTGVVGSIETIDKQSIFVFDKFTVSIEKIDEATSCNNVIYNDLPEHIILRAACQYCATKRFLFSAKPAAMRMTNSSNSKKVQYRFSWLQRCCPHI